MSEAGRRATERIREWRANPCKFVYDVFGATPDAWQEQVLAEAGKPGRKRIAMKACAGPGKSTALAWLGWHRLACFAEKGEHPKGAAVSITRENLSDNLWAELAKWRQRSEFLREAFEWTASQIYARDFPETWFLSARGFPKSADSDAVGRTLSGLHSRFPFALIDESGDMPTQIVKSAEQALSTCSDGLLATAGNPTSQIGLLHHVCTIARAQWFLVTITGDPDDESRSSRIDLEWAREQIATWGRDNPWVMAFILGLFPPGGINALLGVDEVDAAMKRHYEEDAYTWAQKRLGIDVARFGDDRTVIFPRQGLVALEPIILRHQRTTDIAAIVAKRKREWGSEMEFVDDTGHWGHGVIDNLVAAGYNPIGLQYHGKAFDPRYANLRCEMWMGMADWVKRGGALPPIPELVGELTAPTYSFVNGKFLLEDKDQIKKRLGKSPDLGDALANTFAFADEPASILTGHPALDAALGRKTRNKSDYDPLEER